jgi:ADP-ribosylglycohydrolase
VKTILILEDNDERIAAFRDAIVSLGEGWQLKVWLDAPTMMAECESWFPSAALISLDHDLNSQPGATRDPGTGMDVARFLADFLPVCPVILHSTNADRVWSMHNEFRFAGWTTERVGPLGNNWIHESWLPKVRAVLGTAGNTWQAKLPSDHEERVERMMLSLTGLGIGDALGEMLSYNAHSAPEKLRKNELPAGPWFHTDDTEMAISIAAVLKSHGTIHQDALAKRFMRRFERDPERGYGKMTRIQLRDMIAGAGWRQTAANAFGGQGSMGNGGAMRVTPLGAYFADDLERVVVEARASAEVTHTHHEGVSGTIAVALAAAMAWRLRSVDQHSRATQFFADVLRFTPESQVRGRTLLASEMPADTSVDVAAKTLGNGFLVTAPDTVPFTLWIAHITPTNLPKHSDARFALVVIATPTPPSLAASWRWPWAAKAFRLIGSRRVNLSGSHEARTNAIHTQTLDLFFSCGIVRARRVTHAGISETLLRCLWHLRPSECRRTDLLRSLRTATSRAGERGHRYERR